MKLPATLGPANLADFRAKKDSLTIKVSYWGPRTYVLLMVALGALTMLCSALWTIFCDAPFILVAIALFFLAVFVWCRRVLREAPLKAETEAIATSAGEVTLDESGIYWRYQVGTEIALEWAGIASWVHTDQTVMFRHPVGMVFLIAIPADKAAADDLIAFVQSHVPPSTPEVPAPITALK